MDEFGYIPDSRMIIEKSLRNVERQRVLKQFDAKE